MKVLVETKGTYSLHDVIGRQTVSAFRPTVVTKTPFMEAHRAGKLNFLEELDDDASDETLASATNAEELEEAIKALPRPGKPAPARDPLDHDGDGKKGGSLPKAKRTTKKS